MGGQIDAALALHTVVEGRCLASANLVHPGDLTGDALQFGGADGAGGVVKITLGRQYLGYIGIKSGDIVAQCE